MVPSASTNLAQVLPKSGPAHGIQARGGLVEKEDAGPVHQAPHDLELAPHPAGVVLERRPELAFQADDRGQAFDALPVFDRHEPEHRPVRVDAVEGDVETDVLLGGEVRIHARVLEDDPDRPADAGRVRVQVVAVDVDAALGLGEGCGQDRDGGRLAGTVRPQEREQLARLDFEADVVDCRDGRLLVSLGQVFDANDWLHLLPLVTPVSVLARSIAGSQEVVKPL